VTTASLPSHSTTTSSPVTITIIPGSTNSTTTKSSEATSLDTRAILSAVVLEAFVLVAGFIL
jgi:hypothetical protein